MVPSTGVFGKVASHVRLLSSHSPPRLKPEFESNLNLFLAKVGFSCSSAALHLDRTKRQRWNPRGAFGDGG